ncbi:MAG: hypothetical protein EA428_07400 [Spirochaetaceae bacterium]|nr:MAG: hypothetical protein EA428_07400 [Spirochaetaceae bacterium]
MKTHIQTVILGPRETLSIVGGSSVFAVAGTVWVTDNGRDIILPMGASYCSTDVRNVAVAVNPGSGPATIRVTSPDVQGCTA